VLLRNWRGASRCARAVHLLLASLLLSACGSDDETKPDTEKSEEKKTEEKKSDEHKNYKNKIATADPICPQVAVVRGLDIVRDYGNENPDPGQLVAAAKLLGVVGDCEYTDADSDNGAGIDVAFHINMAAKRGPRLGGLHTSFPIFVAVLDPSGEVLNKNQMTINVNFSSEDPLANHAEAMHVFIPLAKDKKNTGPYYRVLAGFQLTTAQADQAKAALIKSENQ
jgi:hypothetical protein